MSIKIENVFFTYLPKTPNETQALKGVSLEIDKNSVTAIVGHTGSGKSTLIQMLNALIVPSKGKLIIDEFEIDSSKRKQKHIKDLRKHVGVVFQFPEYQLFEETVEKDVAFGVRNFGSNEKDALKKAHAALLSVGLNETYYTRSPFELSGGERRKVAIAGILAIKPDILVLDEPTAGLDPQSAEEIMVLVRTMHEIGKTIIIVTHDMEIVQTYCDHVIVLKDGLVKFEGKPFELFDTDCSEMSIEIPPLFLFARKLAEKGVPINFNELKNIDDLVNQVYEWRSKK